MPRPIDPLRRYGVLLWASDGRWYPQTWGLVSRLPAWMQRLARRVCARRGHRMSRTEWGYDGGRHLDVWCRWCNHYASVPLSEMPDTGRKALDLMDLAREQFSAEDLQ